MKPKISKEVQALLVKNNQGIKLDIGGGGNPQPGFINIDYRAIKGKVDIVANLEQFPWPLPDDSVSLAIASHVLEHITPHGGDTRTAQLIKLLLKKKIVSQKEIDEWVGEIEPGPLFMRFMDEIWRILKPHGQFMIVVPYAMSSGYAQDPTHVNMINETTMSYFDPMEPRANGILWGIYKPKPWAIEVNVWDVNGNMEIVLRKRPVKVDEKYEYAKPTK